MNIGTQYNTRNNWIAGAAGLITYGSYALIISFPTHGFVILGALLLLQIGLVVFHVRGYYQLTQPVLGMVALSVAATAVLFLVRLTIWQHLYSVAVAGLMVYYMVFLSHTGSQQGRARVSGLVLVLANIFFSASLALGFSIFFSAPLVVVVAVFAGLLFLFPRWLAVIPVSADRSPGTAQLPFTSTVKQLRMVSVWLRGQLLVGNRQHVDKDGTVMVRTIEFTAEDKMTTWLLLGLLIELFVVVSMFPVGIFASASIVTIVAFCAISLVQLNQLGLFKRGFIVRYVSMCAILVLLVLVTAQWS